MQPHAPHLKRSLSLSSTASSYSCALRSPTGLCPPLEVGASGDNLRFHDSNLASSKSCERISARALGSVEATGGRMLLVRLGDLPRPRRDMR